jgi:superfamily II DNA helicase RecQ
VEKTLLSCCRKEASFLTVDFDSTGGGKSLCYQLPALVMNGAFYWQLSDSLFTGMTIVISPLIALMVRLAPSSLPLHRI